MGQSVLGEGAVLSGLEQELLQEPLGFARRHLGPNMDEITAMLQVLGCATLEDLIDKTVPVGLRQREPLRLPAGRSEAEVLQLLRDMAAENQVYRSYIGMGYSACHTPAVIQRNILENPGWYTGYTPYQAEIAQGRLEMLLNFQTLVCELTGLPVANASLLDEGTALAEAIALARAVGDRTRTQVWLDAGCHPQTLAVVRTRLEPLDLVPCVGDGQSWDFTGDKPVAIALPYPNTYGALPDWQPVIQRAKAAGVLVIAVTDLLALTLWEPPGDWGADIAVGSAQRLGVPMGYGGPHAAFLAAREEFRRQLPGRIVGVSKDRTGQPALRLALQTREQHIRREKATSNICTAQVLLAVMAAAYAIYHGPEGLRTIAQKMRQHTYQLAIALQHQGWTVSAPPYFDTFTVELPAGVSLDAIRERSHQQRLNLREIDGHTLGIALDETTTAQDLADIYEVLTGEGPPAWPAVPEFPGDRPLTYLPQPVFRQHRAEADFLRYLRRLERKDFTLGEGMMPLGSCTMKLNATAELLPVSWPEFMHLHPFAPAAQTQGYQRLIQELENWLAEITGFAAISLQPNAGAQGEYAGLLAIRGYHRHRGESHRNVCLIPQSAHGTNPASAVMAGMKVVPVACDRQGNIDVADLTAKAEQYRDTLAALMITYPSTHGVFEAAIAEVCAIVKERGGRVYVDGANTNALVGLCRVADFGADVCHLNLHKTFCIPHGGGGPGVGPIGVVADLAPFLPGHPLNAGAAVGPVAAAPYGSAGILAISYAYIALMGGTGLTLASKMAILHANYLAQQLGAAYPVLYTGEHGRVAHECILDLRGFKPSADIDVDDIAKRLMDYGFHAPTVSWPVAGTVMVEPTESEPKAELDRFVRAMQAIRQEIAAIEAGESDRQNNPLKNAPHTALALAGDWPHPYSREQAVFPLPEIRAGKFWPSVARIDNAWGDRHLVCTCDPVADYAEAGV